MANELIKNNYSAIADAIRSKTGENGTMTANEMPDKIASIIIPTGTISIEANGNNIDVTQYASANVNVPNPSTGTLDVFSNNVYDVTNYASVDVQVPNPSTGTLEITENDTYDVTDYASVDVQVSGGGSITWKSTLSDTANFFIQAYATSDNSGTEYGSDNPNPNLCIWLSSDGDDGHTNFLQYGRALFGNIDGNNDRGYSLDAFTDIYVPILTNQDGDYDYQYAPNFYLYGTFGGSVWVESKQDYSSDEADICEWLGISVGDTIEKTIYDTDDNQLGTICFQFGDADS